MGRCPIAVEGRCRAAEPGRRLDAALLGLSCLALVGRWPGIALPGRLPSPGKQINNEAYSK